MEDKNKFQEMLKDVLEVARVQGNELGMNEIKELFGGMGLKEEQYEHIFAYLAANRIKVKGYVNTSVLEEYKQAVSEEDYGQEGKEEEKELSGEQAAEGEEGERPERAEETGKNPPAGGADSQYLKMYLKDLAEIKKADEDEFAELLRAVREKKTACKERFIELHLHRVVDLAKLYQNRGVTLEDLIQEGNIGLLCAVESLYTDTVLEGEGEFIEGFIRNALEQIVYESSESSSFEKEMIDKISYIRRASEELKEELGREGNIHELARYVKMSEEELIDIINMSADGVKLSKEHN